MEKQKKSKESWRWQVFGWVLAILMVIFWFWVSFTFFSSSDDGGCEYDAKVGCVGDPDPRPEDYNIDRLD